MEVVDQAMVVVDLPIRLILVPHKLQLVADFGQDWQPADYCLISFDLEVTAMVDMAVDMAVATAMGIVQRMAEDFSVAEAAEE